MVTLALPAIGRDLEGGFALAQWVVDGYLLTLGALLLLGGAVGDRLGRRRVFLVGLLVFMAASLACGLATSGPVLIVARLVQGVGGALLVPGSLALIDASIRPEDWGRAIGTWAGLAGIASATGPFVGGYLIDALSWRWAFFINIPLTAAAVFLTLRHAPESRNRKRGGLDVAGSVAVTVGLAGVIYALIEVPVRGWDSISVCTAVAGLLGLVAFPRWPLTVGPLTAAVGLGLLGPARAGSEYLTGVLPGVVLLGLGLTLTAAPLTSAVLASVSADHVGAASGINNAISRIAGLLAVAVLPVVAGMLLGATRAGPWCGSTAGPGRTGLCSCRP